SRRWRAMLQVGHNVRRVHDNDIIVDERWHFNTAVHPFKGSVIGLQQAVYDLIVDALEVEDHSHLASERTERTIVELDHGHSSCRSNSATTAWRRIVSKTA